jgi:hypothetical protein
MILNLDGEPLDPELYGWTFWDSPTLQDSIQLKPEIPVQPARVMLLNNESERLNVF